MGLDSLNTTMMIKLQTMSEVINFVYEIANMEGKFEIISGSNSADAKSIMGIFNLDLSGPLKLEIITEDKEQIVRLEKYKIVV